MTIGERLAALPFDARRHELRLKETVRWRRPEIAQEYLAEIAPTIGEVDPTPCFRRACRPGVHTRAEMEAPGDDEGRGARSGDAPRGCLGHVARPRARRVAAALPAPGRGGPDPDGSAPPATHYLVHPVLDDAIARLNPAFAQRTDRVNIVGLRPPLARRRRG